MEKYFANLGIMKEKGELPFRFKLPSKTPEIFLKWYIKRYNPYTIEEIQAFPGKGFEIRLPLLEGSLDETQRGELVLRTAGELLDLGVEVLSFREDFGEGPDIFRDFGFFMPEGDIAFCYFLKDAVMRALKHTGKSLKRAECVIIGENNAYTFIALSELYPELNFLTVVTERENFPLFERQSREIFGETGLNIIVTNKANLKDADIIINTSAGKSYDYSYKKGAIYAEPPINGKRFRELLGKREDIFAFDGILLKKGEEMANLAEYETYLYLNNKGFRRQIKKFGENYERLYAEVKNGARLWALMRNGRKI